MNRGTVRLISSTEHRRGGNHVHVHVKAESHSRRNPNDNGALGECSAARFDARSVHSERGLVVCTD